MSVAERAAMNDMARGVYDAMREGGHSVESLNPAATLAQHLPTGELRWALNDAAGMPPEPLSPLLKPRIAEMPADVRSAFERTRGAGSHSEVFAANDLLTGLLDAKPEEIAVRTIETELPKFRGMYKPPCPHCGYILDGVYSISD